MENKFDCFLTHDWGIDEENRSNHDRVVKVSRVLRERGITPWIDETEMTGDTDDQMCNGINSSSCVVVFITKRYHDKVNSGNHHDNCRKEFKYSVSKKGATLMISVVMEKGMRNITSWDGIIQMHLGSILYVDMTSDDPNDMKNSIEQLIKEIALRVPSITQRLITPVSQLRVTSKCTKQDHEAQELNLFCETCESLICAHCILSEHPPPEHKLLKIKDAVIKYKFSIEESLQEGEKKLPIIETEICKLTSTLNEMQISSKNIKEQIILENKILIESIEFRQKRLLSEIENISNEKEKLLINKLQNLRIQKDEIKNYFEFTKQMLSDEVLENNNNCGQLKFLMFKSEISERLLSLRNVDIDISSDQIQESVKNEMVEYSVRNFLEILQKLSESNENCMNFLSKLIKNCGEIKKLNRDFIEPPIITNVKFDENFCGNCITLSNNNKIATRTTENNRYSSVIGTIPNQSIYKFKILSGQKNEFTQKIGLTTKKTFNPNDINWSRSGWYIHCHNGSLWSQNGDNGRKYHCSRISSGQIIQIIYNKEEKNICFVINGIDRGIAFENVNLENLDVFPVVEFFSVGQSVELE